MELDDPSLTLADAGITGKAWLLAFVAGARDAARLPFRLQATRAHATAAGARAPQRQSPSRTCARWRRRWRRL